jgi:hypothetical protein
MLTALHVYRTVEEVKRSMRQIDNPKIRNKVERFIGRFEDIFAQELSRVESIKRVQPRSLSLCSEPGQTEITWIFPQSGAGFVFEEDCSSWYYNVDDNDTIISVSGSLTDEAYAETIRDLIRRVPR